MSDLDTCLIRCFCAVFSKLNETTACQAQRSLMKEDWDSLASVLLIRVIEQEFGVEIDLFELEVLDSYAAIRQYLMESVP